MCISASIEMAKKNLLEEVSYLRFLRFFFLEMKRIFERFHNRFKYASASLSSLSSVHIAQMTSSPNAANDPMISNRAVVNKFIRTSYKLKNTYILTNF